MLTKDMERNYRAIDSNGYYIGDRLYKLSPSHIEVPKPEFDEKTQKAKWNGKEWIIEDIENEEDN